jgi:Uma2 family endonuclease
MMRALTQPLSLREFLTLPETQPTSEYIDGKVVQKPMPQGEHSRLQYKLCAAINSVAEPPKIAFAFPELRCTFGGRSIVPDIAVFRWSRIPRTETGKVANRFEISPDWVIEILSPGQSLTLLLDKLLHCSQQGMSLGWLINVEEETVFVMAEDRRLDLLKRDTTLPVLEGLDLSLTVQAVLNWLVL